jgi:septal ring factor EnvC (AmiA/AmiB activator)
MENIYTVLITVITVLGGTSAWKYYEKRAIKKDEDDDFIKNDCKSRITKLESLLKESSKEKEELRSQILKLVEEVAILRTEIRFLTELNKKL